MSPRTQRRQCGQRRYSLNVRQAYTSHERSPAIRAQRTATRAPTTAPASTPNPANTAPTTAAARFIPATDMRRRAAPAKLRMRAHAIRAAHDTSGPEQIQGLMYHSVIRREGDGTTA
jgi:hypothetical protein